MNRDKDLWNKEIGQSLGGSMYKILIVEDEEAFQILYADELTEEGYESIILRDASQVMALIENKRPDLVLLDIALGECNGLDILQDIRNTYYDLPVILCTAYSSFRYDLKSVAADYYVVKNSNLKELKHKIRMAIEASKQFPLKTFC
jgi:DNA-binding response OmpR family regulator